MSSWLCRYTWSCPTFWQLCTMVLALSNSTPFLLIFPDCSSMCHWASCFPNPVLTSAPQGAPKLILWQTQIQGEGKLDSTPCRGYSHLCLLYWLCIDVWHTAWYRTCKMDLCNNSHGTKSQLEPHLPTNYPCPCTDHQEEIPAPCILPQCPFSVTTHLPTQS